MARKYHCEIAIVNDQDQEVDRKYLTLTASSACQTPEDKMENLTDRLDSDLWTLLQQGRPIGQDEWFKIVRMTDRNGETFVFDQ